MAKARRPENAPVREAVDTKIETLRAIEQLYTARSLECTSNAVADVDRKTINKGPVLAIGHLRQWLIISGSTTINGLTLQKTEKEAANKKF
jgi:hypothetical protein